MTEATYRSPPPEPPLVVCHGKSVFAIDPATGSRLWEARVELPVARVFVLGDRVLLCVQQFVHCHDVATGRLVGSVDTALVPTEGVMRGTTLVLFGTAVTVPAARPDGWIRRPRAVCLTPDGTIAWRIVSEVRAELFGGVGRILCERADGTETVVVEDGNAFEFGSPRPALAWGPIVVQPDNS